MIGPESALILPADIVITPVSDLPDDVRNRLDAPPGAYTMTRPRSRTLTRIIEAEGADLLQEFRKPRRIVEAVLFYSLSRQLDPEAVLQAAFPLFEELISNQLLVEPDSAAAEAVSPSLSPGSWWHNHQIVRCVRALTDTEVYEVADLNGHRLALKIARTPAPSDILDPFSREAAILRHLDGAPAPRLVAEGDDGGRRFILTEWIPGTDAETAAIHHREGGDESALLRLCEHVLDAYAALHRAGVVHGDVQPSNLMVSRSGAVFILDYGWSTQANRGRRRDRLARAATPEYREPEYARAALRHRPLPSATFLSDQYGVAVLVYRMLTGQAYLRFSLVEQQSLVQIARDPPLAFALQGVRYWPSVEGALLRALSKKPSERFASMAAFSEAFRRYPALRSPPSRRSGPNAARRLLGLTLRRLRPGGSFFEAAALSAPTCSIYLGMAGTSLGLLHIGCVREDPRLISQAEVWAELCNQMSGRRSAFLSPRLEMTAPVVGRVSIYHARPGLGYLTALLAHARGDSVGRDHTLTRWLGVTRLRSHEIELSLGEAGLLLALAFTAELVGAGNSPAKPRLSKAGKRLHDRLCRSLQRRGPLSRPDQRLNLGIAHGWAGVLYAILRWELTAGLSLSPSVEGRLEELASRATVAESGARWPWLTADGQGRVSSGYMPGWCNGSAGMIGLWTLAHRVTGKERFLRMAELAALDAWQHDPGETHLCCGLAGIAYGLLNLYRYTGEPAWLERATSVADRAARRALDATRTNPPETAHSLFRGDLGLAVLLADLERPEDAAFPVFDSPG